MGLDSFEISLFAVALAIIVFGLIYNAVWQTRAIKRRIKTKQLMRSANAELAQLLK